MNSSRRETIVLGGLCAFGAFVGIQSIFKTSHKVAKVVTNTQCELTYWENYINKMTSQEINESALNLREEIAKKLDPNFDIGSPIIQFIKNEPITNLEMKYMLARMYHFLANYTDERNTPMMRLKKQIVGTSCEKA